MGAYSPAVISSLFPPSPVTRLAVAKAVKATKAMRAFTENRASFATLASLFWISAALRYA